MLDLTTIEVAELARVHGQIGAVRPTVRLRPACPSAPPAPLVLIGRPDDQPALQAVNDASRTVNELGCQFVCDVTVSGASYVFHGEELLTDGSHLSDVAIEWVTRPMPDSPRAIAPATETTVDRLCIVATAPGHLIYGHWLVDFIPRLMIARDVLGPEFERAVVALPHDTPKWAMAMMNLFAGITPGQCQFFERGVERLAVREACLPTYGHTDYFFHPYVLEIMQAIGTPVKTLGTRKLCVSRVAFESHTHGVMKHFSTRERFEAMAVSFGYEVVRPETMGLLDQIDLFRSASHVVGEYGSALHSTFFAPPGVKVGFIRCPNPIQLRIAALTGQASVVILPSDDHVAPNGIQEYSLTDEELTAFYQTLDG